MRNLKFFAYAMLVLNIIDMFTNMYIIHKAETFEAAKSAINNNFITLFFIIAWVAIIHGWKGK